MWGLRRDTDLVGTTGRAESVGLDEFEDVTST